MTNSNLPTVTSVVPVATNYLLTVTNSSLQKIYSSLQTAPDAKVTRNQLAELRATLAAMSTKEAVATIRQMLDSKADAPTQLGFKVASDGFLDAAPTLRTFLLDELGRIDPAAAADYARVILASMDSPDEWAVALRNLARGDTSVEGHDLLAEKTAAMLQNESWQQNPSVGFLESFDMAVYLGGTSLMPTLSEMVKRPEDPAISHAAYLALDRLVINDTTTTLTALQADPDLMQGREATRANYFARADVRNPDQRQVLENYLLNPQISAAELNAFCRRLSERQFHDLAQSSHADANTRPRLFDGARRRIIARRPRMDYRPAFCETETRIAKDRDSPARIRATSESGTITTAGKAVENLRRQN